MINETSNITKSDDFTKILTLVRLTGLETKLVVKAISSYLC